MLNPSTADATTDDPTIRRVIRFSTDWGFGRLIVVNLYAQRATKPKHLAIADLYFDVIGPENNRTIIDAALHSEMVVVAWGAGGGLKIHDRAKHVYDELRDFTGEDVHCLGTTKAGEPRHPLYVAAVTEPEIYTRAV